jgi:hypothetical protein
MSRRPALARTALWGAATTAVVSGLVVGSASLAGASTIGTLKLTGQVAGSLKLPKEFTTSLGVGQYGCQVQQENNQDLLNFPVSKLSLNGKKAKMTGIALSVSASKDGAATSAVPGSGGSQAFFNIRVGTKNYQWTSTSGSIKVNAKGNGGSVALGLVPSSQAPGGNPIQSGGATKPIHLSITWTSCHALNLG